MPYVPHRHREGYGFSVKGIDNVKKQFEPALIISVDHGITKIKEVDYAKKIGIKIIITDHHLKQEKIPKAEAIFHIPELSGSGVAYFFAKEIFAYLNNQAGGSTSAVEEERSDGKTAKVKRLAENFLSDYLSLAAIGTVADLVPLVGPSRSIAKYGLEAFSKVKRYGLKHILKEAGIEGKKITPYEVGFMIAPRLNAVGRLEHAIDALRLLCTTDETRAKHLASQLSDKNRERQDLVKSSLEEAKKILLKMMSTKQADLKTPAPKIIILTSKTWNEGIIGLIASKISEEFYRPTLVLTKTDGVYKGSARSIPGFDITSFIRSLNKKNLLVDVGGHPQAAGFTLDENKLNLFVTTAINRLGKIIKDKDLEKKIEIDIKIPLSKISKKLAKELEKLAPFGVGNPRPTFFSQGELINAKIFGKNNEHLKIYLKDKFVYEFISFNSASEFSHLSRGKIIEVIYRLEIDRWGGNERLRGIVQHLDLL